MQIIFPSSDPTNIYFRHPEPVNFPDETGKMSEGQKGGGTAEVQEKHAREKSKKGLRLKEKNLSFRLT